MIRINLLPVRAEKKKESIRQQLSIGFLIIILALSVMAYLQISLSKRVDAVRQELTRVQEEISRYRKLMREVKAFKAKKEMLKKKIEIINELERKRGGPLMLLEDMSDLIPPTAWLESLVERDGVVEIKGIAADNETIAEFMRRLEASPHYDKVELIVTRKIERGGMGLKSFSISFSTLSKLREE